MNHEKHERHEKETGILFKDECYQIQGAIFEDRKHKEKIQWGLQGESGVGSVERTENGIADSQRLWSSSCAVINVEKAKCGEVARMFGC